MNLIHSLISTVTACLLTIRALQRAEIQRWLKSKSHNSSNPSGSTPTFQRCQRAMPLRPDWRISALLSFLCSLPYCKWSEHAKVSSPAPLPRRAWPDNCPGNIHSSENTPYFPGCTVVPPNTKRATKSHLEEDKEVMSGDCEKGLKSDLWKSCLAGGWRLALGTA